jgi:hypothetical protein
LTSAGYYFKFAERYYGSTLASALGLNGSLDEIRFYTSALNFSDVGILNSTGRTSSSSILSSNMMAYYPMGENSGDYVHNNLSSSYTFSIYGAVWYPSFDESSFGSGSTSTGTPYFPSDPPPFSVVLMSIRSGASLGEVALAWNPDVYPILKSKLRELFSGNKLADLPSLIFDSFFLLIKYIFRQPASLVAGGY